MTKITTMKSPKRNSRVCHSQNGGWTFFFQIWKLVHRTSWFFSLCISIWNDFRSTFDEILSTCLYCGEKSELVLFSEEWNLMVICRMDQQERWMDLHIMKRPHGITGPTKWCQQQTTQWHAGSMERRDSKNSWTCADTSTKNSEPDL